MTGSAIRVRGLRVAYRSTMVLDGVDLDVPFGETTVVVGPNGAGKSTLLRAIAGVVASTGRIRLLDAPLEQVRRDVAFVAQEGRTADDLPITAIEVVRMGRYPHRGWWGRFRREDHAAVAAAMEATGVTDLADAALAELSGGQRRRVVVARALAQQARILLLDEPFAAVDATTEDDLLVTLAAVGRRPDRCVVVVHHDLDTARRRFDRAVVLGAGAVVAQGPTGSAMAPWILHRAYGIAP